MTPETIALIGLAVAGLSLLVSFITLYISHLKAADIQASTGPYIRYYHADYSSGEGTGFYLPVTFFNSSSKSAVVTKTAIEIYKKTNDQKRFFLLGRGYSVLNTESNKWENKEIAHALPILGKSSIHKVIRYYWLAENQEKLTLDEGVYSIGFLYWIKGREKPSHSEHELIIDSSTNKKIDRYRELKKTSSVEVVMDREMASNNLLSLHESKKLLGKTA